MDQDLEVCPDPAAVAARAASHVADLARAALAAGSLAVTLTYPALARAARILWLVTGADKQKPLARLLSGDRSIPAGRVQAGHSLVLADAQAAERVRGAAPAQRDGDRG